MSEHRRRADIIADPSFAARPGDLDDATLRSRRQLCLDVERELSYYRRLLHGRIDLLDFEQRRRRGESPGGAAVETLGAILGDEAAGPGRASAAALGTEPVILDRPGRRPLDLVLDDDVTSRLEALTDAELMEARARAEEVEREISSQRRAVHQAEEALAGELARRYRDGAISADNLIS